MTIAVKNHTNYILEGLPNFTVSLYFVSNILSRIVALRRNFLSDIEEIKQKLIELFAKDRLHKLHWNLFLLEKTNNNNNNELTYVKQLFLKETTVKIVDLGRIKASDTLFVIILTYRQKAIAVKL